MKTICTNCHKEISLNSTQENFISNAKKNNMSFAMLNCLECGISFAINPQNLSDDIVKKNIDNNFRCPIQGCHGHVVKIDDFYGCGECGNTWHSEKELYNNIEKIIHKFPYRKSVYSCNQDNFVPISKQDEPSDYEDMVRKELII